MDVKPTEIIDNLLLQNSQLRLELATLSAMKRQFDEIEAQMEQSKSIPPEAIEMLSKLDIR